MKLRWTLSDPSFGLQTLEFFDSGRNTISDGTRFEPASIIDSLNHAGREFGEREFGYSWSILTCGGVGDCEVSCKGLPFGNDENWRQIGGCASRIGVGWICGRRHVG